MPMTNIYCRSIENFITWVNNYLNNFPFNILCINLKFCILLAKRPELKPTDDLIRYRKRESQHPKNHTCHESL